MDIVEPPVSKSRYLLSTSERVYTLIDPATSDNGVISCGNPRNANDGGVGQDAAARPVQQDQAAAEAASHPPKQLRGIPTDRRVNAELSVHSTHAHHAPEFFRAN